MRDGSATRTTFRYWLVLGLMSFWIFCIFIRPAKVHFGINQYERALFTDLVDGTAHRPYQYRALLPLLTRALTAPVPDSFRDGLTETIERNHLLRRGFERLYWDPAQADRFLVGSVLMFLCFLGFGHFTSRLAMVTLGLPDRLPIRTLLGALALLCLPAFFVFASYPYDPPTLLLFAAALFLLATGRTSAFLAVFALACLNKETAILLVPVFLFAGGSPDRRRTLIAAGMTGGWLLLRVVLLFAYRSNPGGVVEFHLLDHNLHSLTRPWNWPELTAFLAVSGALAFRWREQPRLLRVAFLGTLPPLFAASLLFGYVGEWRDYYEAFPAAFALAAGTVWHLRQSPGLGGRNA